MYLDTDMLAPGQPRPPPINHKRMFVPAQMFLFPVLAHKKGLQSANHKPFICRFRVFFSGQEPDLAKESSCPNTRVSLPKLGCVDFTRIRVPVKQGIVMTDKINALCDSIIAKAHEFVGVGDFSAVSAAAEALSAIAKCGADLDQKTNHTESEAQPAEVQSVSTKEREVQQPAVGTITPNLAQPAATTVEPDQRPKQLTGQELADCLRSIDESLASAGYEADDWEILRRRRISTSEAASFAGISKSTILNWCNAGSVLCDQDPNRKRVTWLICPRSIALRINSLPDPRIV